MKVLLLLSFLNSGLLLSAQVFSYYNLTEYEYVTAQSFFGNTVGFKADPTENTSWTYIINAWPDQDREGFLFFAGNNGSNVDVFDIYNDEVVSNIKFRLKGPLTFDHSLNQTGQGTIQDAKLIHGKDDLLLLGSINPGQRSADIYIAKNGFVGIGNGTNLPNGALHVVGLDNSGSTASLTIDDNRGQRMLIDGNEVDAIRHDLNLQSNAIYNVNMVAGGGKVGIGGVVPAEKLHVLGNLRMDDGRFLSNGAMIFQTAVGSDTSTNNNVIFQNNAGIELMRINPDGNVGIGTGAPSQKLEVDGSIKASSFISSASIFPDYVFEQDYQLASLHQINAYVKKNKHLPNMPAEKEVVENGLNVTDVVVKSVENIETIYLHLIQLNEKVEALEKENAELKSLINNSL